MIMQWNKGQVRYQQSKATSVKSNIKVNLKISQKIQPINIKQIIKNINCQY